jgi:hypothetical protein
MEVQNLIGWAVFGFFILVWVGFAVFSSRKGWSRTISYAGGFVASCTVLALLSTLAIPFATEDRTREPPIETGVSPAPASDLAFDAVTISSFYAAGAAMIYCDQLSDAQAKTVGDTVRFMAVKGGIPKSEVKNALLLGGIVAKEDLEATGGCGGAHFQDYKRNYYEYIDDPAIAHLQIANDSVGSEPPLSQFEQVVSYLEQSPTAVCRNLATTLRNSNPGAEESILRSAEKYGCL